MQKQSHRAAHGPRRKPQGVIMPWLQISLVLMALFSLQACKEPKAETQDGFAKYARAAEGKQSDEQYRRQGLMNGFEVFWDMGDGICLLATDLHSMEGVIQKFQNQSGRRVASYRPFSDGAVAELADGGQQVLWYQEIDCKDPPFNPLGDHPTGDEASFHEGGSYDRDQNIDEGEWEPASRKGKDISATTSEVWMGSVGDDECELTTSGSVYTSPFIFTKHGQAELEEKSASGDVVVLSTNRVDDGSKVYVVFSDTSKKCNDKIRNMKEKVSL